MMNIQNTFNIVSNTNNMPKELLTRKNTVTTNTKQSGMLTYNAK